jgi:hypothetical protein
MPSDPQLFGSNYYVLIPFRAPEMAQAALDDSGYLGVVSAAPELDALYTHEKLMQAGRETRA